MLLKEISDDLLVCLWREKNQDAFDLLQCRYNCFIYGIIKDCYKKCFDYIDFDDLYQDAFLVFLKCIDMYDEENGCFYFFVRKSIERCIFNFLKKRERMKRVSSLDSMFYDNGRESIVDYICEDSLGYEFNPLYDKLVSKLGTVNKRIVDYKMQGYTYMEIGEMLHISRSGIYSRVNKIKNILKDIIEKID